MSFPDDGAPASPPPSPLATSEAEWYSSDATSTAVHAYHRLGPLVACSDGEEGEAALVLDRERRMSDLVQCIVGTYQCIWEPGGWGGSARVEEEGADEECEEYVDAGLACEEDVENYGLAGEGEENAAATAGGEGRRMSLCRFAESIAIKTHRLSVLLAALRHMKQEVPLYWRCRIVHLTLSLSVLTVDEMERWMNALEEQEQQHQLQQQQQHHSTCKDEKYSPPNFPPYIPLDESIVSLRWNSPASYDPNHRVVPVSSRSNMFSDTSPGPSPLVLPVSTRNRLLVITGNIFSKSLHSISNYHLGTQPHARRLILHWRPLMEALHRACPVLSGQETRTPTAVNHIISNATANLLRVCRQAHHFYDLEDTNVHRDIWDTCAPDLQCTQVASTFRGAVVLRALLPTHRAPQSFYDHALPILLRCWQAVDACPDHDATMLSMVEGMQSYCPTYDWKTVRSFLWTRTAFWLHLPGGGSEDRSWPAVSQASRGVPYRLRAMVPQGGIGGMGCIEKLTDLLLVRDADGGPGGMPDLLRFLAYVAPYYNPSNTGAWTQPLGLFLYCLLSSAAYYRGVTVGRRALQELHPELLQQNDSAKSLAGKDHLHAPTDEDMVNLLSACLPLCLNAIYSKSPSVTSDGTGALQILCLLMPRGGARSGLEFAARGMGGEMLHQGHAASGALDVCRKLMWPALGRNPDILLENLPPLLNLSLPGIDGNDQTKTIKTLALYLSLTSFIPVGAPENEFNGSSTVKNVILPHISDVSTSSFVQHLSPNDPLYIHSIVAPNTFHDLVPDLHLWLTNLLTRTLSLLTTHTRADKTRPSHGTMTYQGALVALRSRHQASMLREMLHQIFCACDKKAHKIAVNIVAEFIQDKTCFDAVRDLSGLLQGLVNAQPSSVQKIIPILVKDVENLPDNVVAYRLRLLSGVVRFAGPEILKYEHTILKCVRVGLEAVRDGHRNHRLTKATCKLIRHLLFGLCEFYPLGHSYRPTTIGQNATLNTCKVAWHIPSGKEIDLAAKIWQEFPLSMLNILEEETQLAKDGQTTRASESARGAMRILHYALRGGIALLLDSDSQENSANPLHQSVKSLLSKASPESQDLFLNLRTRILDTVGMLLDHAKSSLLTDPKILSHLLAVSYLIILRRSASIFSSDIKRNGGGGGLNQPGIDLWKKLYRSHVMDLYDAVWLNGSQYVFDRMKRADLKTDENYKEGKIITNRLITLRCWIAHHVASEQYAADTLRQMKRNKSIWLNKYEKIMRGVLFLACRGRVTIRSRASRCLQMMHFGMPWITKNSLSDVIMSVTTVGGNNTARNKLVPQLSMVTQPPDQVLLHANAEIVRGSLTVLSTFVSRITSIRSNRDAMIKALVTSFKLQEVVDAAEVSATDAAVTNVWLRYRNSWKELPGTEDKNLVAFLTNEIVSNEKNDDKHWKYQLLASWFLVTLYPSCPPLEAIRSAAISLLSSPNVLLSRAGFSLLGRYLLDSNESLAVEASVLGKALTSCHTSVRQNLSRGIDEIIRDLASHSSRFTLSMSRNGRCSEMFSEKHADTICNFVRINGGRDVEKLSKIIVELASSPPSEDQAGQQCSAAEMFAGLVRGCSLICDMKTTWDKTLPILSEVIMDSSIDTIRHWSDSLRYIVSKLSVGNVEHLVEWGVGWVERTLVGYPNGVRDDIIKKGGENMNGSSSGESFTSQSKWIAIMSAIIIDLDSKTHQAPYHNAKTQITDLPELVKVWSIIRTRFLPALLNSIAHEYESCRNYISSSMFQVCYLYKKVVACRAALDEKNELEKDPDCPQAIINKAFYLFLDGASDNGTVETIKSKLRTRLTLRKLLRNCIHVGDDAEELPKFIIPLLPLAFGSLKFDDSQKRVDSNKNSNHAIAPILNSDNDELSALKLEVTKAFRETLAEISGCCYVSYQLQGDDKKSDIDTILDIVLTASKNEDWQVRQIAVHFLRCFQGGNKFIFHDLQSEKCTSIVTDLLSDERREVSSAAMAALTGILAATSVNLVSHLVKEYIPRAKKSLPKRKKKIRHRNNILSPATNAKPLAPSATASSTKNAEISRSREQQISVFFLCAAVLASPYDTPEYIPLAISALSKHSFESYAPLAIRDAVKKCCSEYKRTHVDNWDLHRMKFDTEQWEALNDVISTPHYYA